jgi:arylsulfatase A
MIKYFSFLFLAFIGLGAAAQNSKTIKKPSKPNIIFIFADDLGIGNIGSYGSDNFKTPNIDLLAKNGIQFNNAYTAPLCGPSRALIMTGRYAFRTGAMNQDKTGLMKPTEETMIPKVLKAAGYVTTSIGKWGQLPLDPSDFGYDDYLRFKGSGIYTSTDQQKLTHYSINGTDKVLKVGEYMPDLMHNHLVEFISANKDKPFFAYYPMVHVHGEIIATPDSKPDSKDFFTDNIVYMDKLVGKLMHVLDSMNLRENTLVFFMGDNGTSAEAVLKSTVNGKQLSGKKGSMKECGSLVPMIANWPGKIKGGQVSSQLIDGSDFFPTFAEITGAKLPDSTIIDGRSFAPNLLGKKGKPRDWIFMELGSDWYAREAKWKLNRAGELFDMSNAPFEEPLVAVDMQGAEALAAQIRLQAVLESLDPESGKMDDGDGTGRHKNKEKKKKAKKEKSEN